MRATIAGFFVGILFCWFAFALGDQGKQAVAGSLDSTDNTASHDDSVSVFATADGHQLTLVEKSKQALCVYHIDSKTGEITLKSVRSYGWDLELEHFNGTEPLPRQIRSMLNR